MYAPGSLSLLGLANLVRHADPAEVQTFAMRTKGLLVWNTISQCMGAYVTWVDAIALDKIGMPLCKPVYFRLLIDVIPSGYKYYGVYMPLVAIQWALAYKCRYFALSFRVPRINVSFTVMVETRNYTLGKCPLPFNVPQALTTMFLTCRGNLHGL